MQKINLAIVDDHNLFRKGLIKLINLGDTDNKYAIIFEAGNGMELKEKLDKRLLPDIILMDIDMPDMDGYETVEWLKQYFPNINILVVSMFETEEAVIKMIRLGVKGYLSKDIEVEDIHLALDTISNKGFYYSDFVTGIMATELQNITEQKSLSDLSGSSDKYSENEKKFLILTCTDLTYAQIAEKMFLSPKTIDGYRESLCKKLHVSTRVELALYAVKSGLVKL
jgi:two-component system, NarL family, invasion response regulator UvrY